jgi:arginase
MSDEGSEERDGIEAKTVLLKQLRAALDLISEQNPARITTLGGACSVNLAPFSHLIDKHGDDMAILWINAHPDMGTGETTYPGFHAMVISALTGHGDPELLDLLPATIVADRVALVCMHDWTDPTLPAIADEWGLTAFSPHALRTDSALCWNDWPGSAPRKWPFTSMSTRSTRTRSSWACVPMSAVSPVQRRAACKCG